MTLDELCDKAKEVLGIKTIYLVSINEHWTARAVRSMESDDGDGLLEQQVLCGAQRLSPEGAVEDLMRRKNNDWFGYELRLLGIAQEADDGL